MSQAAPNNAFKPKLHRYTKTWQKSACYVASYALQFSLA
jgi:hypothetical protein